MADPDNRSVRESVLDDECRETLGQALDHCMILNFLGEYIGARRKGEAEAWLQKIDPGAVGPNGVATVGQIMDVGESSQGQQRGVLTGLGKAKYVAYLEFVGLGDALTKQGARTLREAVKEYAPDEFSGSLLQGGDPAWSDAVMLKAFQHYRRTKNRRG